MKPGSIVVVLPLPPQWQKCYVHARWMPIADEKTEYMIRRIDFDRSYKIAIVTFEEGTIGADVKDGVLQEWAYPQDYVREVVPPFSIEEAMKITEKDLQPA